MASWETSRFAALPRRPHHHQERRASLMGLFDASGSHGGQDSPLGHPCPPLPRSTPVHLWPPLSCSRPPCRLLALPPLDLALPHPDIHPSCQDLLPQNSQPDPRGGAAGAQQAAHPWAQSPGLEPATRQPQPLHSICAHTPTGRPTET